MKMKTFAILLSLYVAISSAFPVAPEAEDEEKTLALVEVSIFFSSYISETRHFERQL